MMNPQTPWVRSIFALALAFTLILSIGAAKSYAAVAPAPRGELTVWEHHFPNHGKLFQRKQITAQCDATGYRYTANRPYESSSISFVASRKTLKCNSVWVQSRSGRVFESCVNGLLYSHVYVNFPAFVNDSLKQFGVRHRSTCPLYL